MRSCGCCGAATAAHILIMNDGICNGCADKLEKKRQEALKEQHSEYMRLDRRINAQ